MANPPGPLIRLLLPAQTPTPATLALLPEAEQASVQRYFRAPDRALSLSSALLKHLAIARLCHVPWSATHLRKEEWGKPYYDPPAGATRGAEFNVSHHGLVVVLAGAGHAVGAGGKAGDGPRRVGIDVARVDVSGTAKTVAERGSWESWTQIWADVFSAAEMVEIAGAGGTLEARLRGFYARWALKEAYLKVSGQGLGAPWVKEVEFRAVRVPGKGAGEWGWGEVVRDVQVWVRGVRSTEVALELQGLGGGYIVATAVQGGHGGEPFPPFEEVSVERDVFPLANGAWDSPAVVEDSKGLRDLKPASAKPSFMTVGVLALQGAFHEHIQLLQQASSSVPDVTWKFTEVRNTVDLSSCDALVIPGGESTAISLVAERSGLLEPLRDFVKVQRKPTWGTCAGLILLAEAANRTKQGGQELIGGLDVRVSRNYFGRQVESFEEGLRLDFLQKPEEPSTEGVKPFRAIFIRAPVVEKVLPVTDGEQSEEKEKEDTVIAPSKSPADDVAKRATGRPVEIMATLSRKKTGTTDQGDEIGNPGKDEKTIVAVRQGNVFGTCFHPELTNDARIHEWWLKQVRDALMVNEDAKITIAGLESTVPPPQRKGAIRGNGLLI